jgi:hypothetical protein
MITFVSMANLLLMYGCSRNATTVEYVFPDGFRGAAVIRENQPGGVPSCKSDYFFSRRPPCVLHFSNSGVLNIQGQSPTTQWHNASARYANGTVIPVSYSSPDFKVPKGEIALWSYAIQNGEDMLFVGTEDEFLKFRTDKQAAR